jgi:asparagine synthase (glutamine-hydrolysing)
MCGICGFFGDVQSVPHEMLGRMNQTLERRGPDEGGEFIAQGVGLAMRRLSIIDLHGGRQPIHNEDQTIWVVFNGEIYNYRELRAALIEKGHRFETNSDTEVIVHLYEEYGDRLVDHLRGMFAFSLWDSSRRRGLVARDRLGIKPLFYSHVGELLLFGSEIKAVLASGLVKREIDFQALDAFFTYTYIPAPLTIYRDIRKLEPGHYLIWENGDVRDVQYWDLDMSSPAENLSNEDWSERFEHSLKDAVTAHMVSDVPVGAFLSGGIDSSLVVAMMSQDVKEPVHTFTMGFETSRNTLLDERPLAREVAGRYGCNFHEYTVKPDFRNIVGQIADAFDEPFADDSVIPSYYVSQFARREVKVAMSGLGGDELFAGYERYSGMLLGQHYSRLVPGALHRRLVQPLVQSLPEPANGGGRIDHAKRFSNSVLLSPSERYLGFVSTLNAGGRGELFRREISRKIDFDSTDRIVTEPFERCGAENDLKRALYVDMKTYLPEDILALSDRLSMWHSLEVRVPLIDHNLVELSTRLPVHQQINMRQKKILLRRIAKQYLPKQIFRHKKQGFESPMATWLRGELRDYVRSILSPSRLGASGLFDTEYVSAKLD